MPRNISKYFVTFGVIAVVLAMSLAPYMAYAASVDIPCRPSETAGANNDVFDCVNQLYKYALIISSIGAVITIMIAGYMYIFSGGSDKRVGTAKTLITSSLLGIAVLLSGFLLLKQINPNILTIGNITPNQLAQRDWTEVEDGGEVPPGLPPVTGVTVPTGTAQELASQILNNNRITLLGDSADPRSSARQNIIDTSNGQPAYTSTRGEGRGAQTPLDARMLAAILAMAQISPIQVNYIAGGNHSDTSKHYRGKGFDIQADPKNPGLNKALQDACRAAGATEILGPPGTGYKTAEDHNTHIHCGWP
jgi:hypothetical protein